MKRQINSPHQLGDNLIQAGHIQPDAVTRTKIIDSAININKIADSSIGTSKIVAEAVTISKIKAGDVLRPVALKPSSATAPGVYNDVFVDSDAVYFCIAANTWRKVTLSIF